MTVVSQAAMGGEKTFTNTILQITNMSGLALTIYLFHIGAARLWVRMGFRYLVLSAS
jgi:hypothetical protein